MKNFRNWLRGTNCPHSATLEEWYYFRKAAKEKHPIRYWLAEDGWRQAEKAIKWPKETLFSIKYYIRNRFKTKTHVLKSKLRKGSWVEYNTRLPHCMMDSFVIWVEQEWFKFNCWDEPKPANTENVLKMFEERVKDYQNDEFIPDDGSEGGHIWKIEQMREIYLWWLGYEDLPDPIEESGYSAHYDKLAEKYGCGLFCPETEEERKESVRLSKINQELEEKREKEITNKLIQLIKIRQGLWT